MTSALTSTNLLKVFSEKACFNRCAIRVIPNQNQDSIKKGVNSAHYVIEALGPYGFGSYAVEGNHSVIPARLRETENYATNLCGDFRSVAIASNNDSHYGVSALKLSGGFTQLYVQGDKDYEKIKYINGEEYPIDPESINAPRHRLSGFYRCVELKMPGGWWRIDYPYLRSVRFRGWPINPVDTHRDRHTESIDYRERPDYRLEYGPLWEEERGLVNIQQAAARTARRVENLFPFRGREIEAIRMPAVTPLAAEFAQIMRERAEQNAEIMEFYSPYRRPSVVVGPPRETQWIEIADQSGRDLARVAQSSTGVSSGDVVTTGVILSEEGEALVEEGFLASLIPGGQVIAIISFVVGAISIAAAAAAAFHIFDKHEPPPPAPKHDPIDDECPQGDQRCRELYAEKRHKEYKQVYKNYRRGVTHLKSHLKPQLEIAAAPARETGSPPAPAVAEGAAIINYRAGETYPHYEDCGWPFFLLDGNFFEIELDDQTLGSQLLIQGPCTQIRIWNTNQFPFIPTEGI